MDSVAAVPQADPKAAKPRQRASVACVRCRRKRVKCVAIEDQLSCENCVQNGLGCSYLLEVSQVRPTSKPSTSVSIGTGTGTGTGTLATDRLEPSHNCIDPQQPRGIRRPSTQVSISIEPELDGLRYRAQSPVDRRTSRWASAHPTFNDSFSLAEEGSGTLSGRRTTFQSSSIDSVRSPAASTSSTSSEELVDKLLSTSGHLGFDSSAGTKRYFGPTTNLHVYWSPHRTMAFPQSMEAQRRTLRIVNELSVETHDHLLSCFWRYHNAILRVVERDEFYKDKENGETTSYSGFLHLCMLALGFRFADKSRPEIRRLMLPHSPRESTLHREAKRMVEYELEHLGGIPSVQAMLLLGDLECGCGRDNTGWMFGGMACRLCFDMGLNRDCSALGLSPSEVKIRQTVLWACIVYDKYWALYLGRSTTIKSSDLDVHQLSHQFGRMSTANSSTANNSSSSNSSSRSVENLTYDALLNLMEIAGKITGDNEIPTAASQQAAHLKVAALDRDLREWYKKLPTRLQWRPENLVMAQSPFFLLHQQYHTSLALLHRPFAHLTRGIHDDHLTNLPCGTAENSLNVYLENANQVARVLQEHCKRFDASRLCLNALHHIGTAATAFIFGATGGDRRSRDQSLCFRGHLEFLTQVLCDMSGTYQPAERMYTVLKHVVPALDRHAEMNKLRPENVAPPPATLYRSSSSSIPCRRSNSAMLDVVAGGAELKKRHLENSIGSTSRSMFSPGGGFLGPDYPCKSPIMDRSVIDFDAEAIMSSVNLPPMGGLSMPFDWGPLDAAQNELIDLTPAGSQPPEAGFGFKFDHYPDSWTENFWTPHGG